MQPKTSLEETKDHPIVGVVSTETSNSKPNSVFGRIKAVLSSVASNDELRGRIFRGGAWMGMGSVSEQSFRFLRNMILARLLAPSAFGTMAIVMSTNALLQAFSEIGVREALIQNPRGTEPEYVNTAWWMSFCRSLFVYATLFAAAPYVARFYADPQLTRLLRVAISCLVLEGAMSSRSYIAMKQMKFRLWAMIQHGGGIIGVATTLVLGFFIRNVWALVIGTCTESAARFVLSFVICPFLPSIRIDRVALKDLLRFSRGLFGLAPLFIVFMRTDVFVLGKLISATALGYYSMGIAVAQVPAGFIANLLGQLFMPAMAHVQDDKARMRRIVLQVSAVIVLVFMPAIVFAYFCGGPFLRLVYGPSYAVAVTSLILASCGVLITLLNNPITTAFYATGAPELHRRCIVAMAVTMAALTYPLAKWLGPAGAQVASLISISAGVVAQFPLATRLMNVRASDYGKIFIHGTATSAVVTAFCLLARFAPHANRPVVTVGLGALACLLAYAGMALLFLRNRKLVHDYS
jgi:O-antigen/teichoic acid export membrane protein